MSTLNFYRVFPPQRWSQFSFVFVYRVVCQKEEEPQGQTAGTGPFTRLLFEPAPQTSELTVLTRPASV